MTHKLKINNNYINMLKFKTQIQVNSTKNGKLY